MNLKIRGDREGLLICKRHAIFILPDRFAQCLVIGEEMQGFSVFFPYFVQGKSADLLTIRMMNY